MHRLLSAAAIAFTMLLSAPVVAESIITVYKNPSCGCCDKWVEYLRAKGFEVKTFNRSDTASIKQALGVKPEMASCHTATVGGYVIEGHVPAAAIRRLLATRPNTHGLSVPGMPTNSPGMGSMDGTLKTYTLEGRLFSTD